MPSASPSGCTDTACSSASPASRKALRRPTDKRRAPGTRVLRGRSQAVKSRPMSLSQSIELARAERVGEHGITKAELDAALKKAEAALDWLRARYEDKS